MRKLKVEKLCKRCNTTKNIEQCFYIGKDKKGVRSISSYCKDCFKLLEKEPKRIEQRQAIMANYYQRVTGKTKEQREQERKGKIKPKSCKVYFKLCLVTNKLYTLRTNHSKYFISDEGYKQYNAVTKRERIRLLDNILNNRNIIRTCLNCKKEYNVIKDNNYTTSCCSIKCSDEHYAIMTRKRKAERNYKYGQGRKKAKDLGALVHRVDRIKIFQRDKFKCWICGNKTDKNKIGLCEDNAPTLDHVQPLTYGGSHTATNLKTACFRCNSVRQHRDTFNYQLSI